MKRIRLPKIKTSLSVFIITFLLFGYLSSLENSNDYFYIIILLFVVNFIFTIFLGIRIIIFFSKQFKILIEKLNKDLKEKRDKYIFEKLKGDEV